MGTMITMLAPDGTSGEVPIDKLDAAKSAGFKVGIHMKSPDGKDGYIPAEKVHDAAASGFKMVPLDVPEGAKASYWDALTNPVGAGYRDQGAFGGALQIGGQAIKAAVQPVAHPIDTAVGMYNMVRHPLDTVHGVVQNFKNDMAQGGVPLAVENATGQLAGSVEGGRVLAAASGPLVRGTVKGAAKIALNGKTPEAAYESAIKIPPSVDAATRANAVQTGLNLEIPVSKGGAAKLADLIDQMDKTRQAIINTDPNRPISSVRSLRNLDDTRAKFANQVTPQPDMAEIDAVQQNFLNNPKLRPAVGPGPGSLPAVDAQAVKSGTYQQLGSKAYGELKSANVEAQKALARGYKDEIATQFPELKGLNAAESKALDFQPLLERAVNRISNHQAFGIGTPMMAAGTEAVTGSSKLAAAVGLYKAVFDNPYIKSRLAIAVSKGGKMPLAQATARVNAYAASLGQYGQQLQNASSADTTASPPSQ